MKILLKKAFDVEAFEKIKTRIDSEDITLSETYNLKSMLKDIEREKEHPWFNFFAVFMFIPGFIMLFYIIFFALPVTFFSVLFGIMIFIIMILACYIAINSTKNYFIYKNNYHQQYTDAGEKLDSIQKELQTKDKQEEHALDLFFQQKGLEMYNLIQDYLQKQNIEVNIRERFLGKMRDEFLQTNREVENCN